MVSQVSNPDIADMGSEPTAARLNAGKQIAQLVAEVKQNNQLEASKPHPGGWLAAAMQLKDEASAIRRGSGKISLKDYESGRNIQTADHATQKAAVALALKHLGNQNFIDLTTDQVCVVVLSSLLRRKLPYTDVEIVGLLIPLANVSFIITGLPIAPILANVERHVAEHGLCNSIRQQLQRMATEYNSGSVYSDARKAGQRIEALLAMPACDAKAFESLESKCKVDPNDADSPIASVALDFNTGEAWTNALLIELGKMPDESRNRWHEFLRHCSTAKGSKPTKKFIKQSRECLDGIGTSEFVRVSVSILAAIGQPGECQRFDYGYRIEYSEETEIHDTHIDCLRGLVWTTSLVNDELLISGVGDAAEKCFQKIREVGPRSPKIGNACLIALSTLASDCAIAQLGRLQSRAKHISTRKQIAKAFQTAASNAGMVEEDLVEISVPRYGLTRVGQLHEKMAGFTAEATINAHQKHQLNWRRPDGSIQKTVPKAVKETCSDQLKQLKKRLKDIDILMPSLRYRIEHLNLTERSWNLSNFRKRFLDHPLVGVVACRLIWNVEQDASITTVMWHEGQWVTSAGDSFLPDPECHISLWHPMHCSANEVLQWRQWLDAHQVSQPFKQAHREVYVVTDAERETVDRSLRFSSHIIRQHQFAALCQQRGWRYDLQGDWDSWNAPSLDLPQQGLHIAFYVDPLEGDTNITQNFVYTHVATSHVQFFALQDGAPELATPLPLETIDPIVFSEVMRDVDLFVGVTSIGNDPEWREREGVAEHDDYWEQFSFGELSQSALTRRKALEQILPRLEIADQCRLDGRFLIVDGKIRTYKIHLGSSNILMSPNDRYLCIVQKRGGGTRRTDNLYLPFEGDNTLSLILSKAYLLAKDDKIKDTTIVNQIRTDHEPIRS